MSKALRAISETAKARRVKEFEAAVLEGRTVHDAAVQAGISPRDARREHSRIAATRWDDERSVRTMAEAGAALREFWLERSEAVDAEIREAIERRDSIPKEAALGGAWARLEREIREMRSERAICEERIAALSANIPTLTEITATPVELSSAPLELPAAPDRGSMIQEATP